MSVRVPPHHLTMTGAIALSLCLLVLFAGPTQANVGIEDFKTGEVIVKLDTTLDVSIDDINADYGSTTLDATLGGMDVYLLKPPEGSGTERRFANLLMNDPQKRVVYAEPNFVTEVPENEVPQNPTAGDGRHRAYGVSDRKRSSGTYAENLNLSCAAEISLGEGSTVAVLDTGAQLDHPALRANFRGVARYDFVDNDSKPYDKRVGLDEPGGHGTHVAGIVDQVAPAAKIMPLRVLNRQGFGDVFTIAKAINFAKINGANVINLSLGSSARSDLLQAMVRDAIDSGIVVVAAAGNSATEKKHYPAASDSLVTLNDGLLAVTSVKGSLTEPFVKSDFANFGTWVDIAAPGEGIRSAFPVDKYANWTGTSMATPFVSGQAALIHARYPLLKPTGIEGIEAKIRSSARNIDSDNDVKYLGKLGAGHPDVCTSLQG
jgi:subtilisin family serine protease